MGGRARQGSGWRQRLALAGGGALAVIAFASCGSNTIQPATVYLTSTIGPDPNAMTMTCNMGAVTPQLMIGSVASGVPTMTGATTVTCSVTPSGSDFAVTADVVSGNGSFSVEGTMPKAPGAQGSGVTANLTYGIAGAPISYMGSNCTVTMANNLPATESCEYCGMTPGFDPTAGPPVDGGRVWATVVCDDMQEEGSPGVACQGILTFRLENCTGSPTSS
jgi:hypothetical protein